LVTLSEETKRETILANADVNRWYENLVRGSRNTGEVYIRRLSLFCEQNKTNPIGLLNLSKKRLEDMVLDHVSKMEKQGKAPGYTEGMIKSVKSWLAHNEIKLTRRIRIHNSRDTPTLADEVVPTQEELKKILSYADERSRTAIGLIANAGLRLETLGNESGTDGLRIGDLPELIIESKETRFKEIPTMIVVRPELSKAGHRYFTFLTKEGCEYLNALLDKRIATGERLRPSSPIIAVTPGFELKGKGGRNRGSMFITTKNISSMIRRVLRPTFKWRPYVFRAYFDSGMMVAENHGKISHPYSVFFMGHKGDMSSRYSTHKGRLRDQDIEDMRTAFKKCQEFLQSSKPETETNEILAQFKKQLLMVAGYKESEISSIDLHSLSNESLQKMTREKLIGTLTANGARTLIVPGEQLENYLKQGYEYLDSPPALNGRSIVRFPN
jgi:hypothetical protein